MTVPNPRNNNDERTANVSVIANILLLLRRLCFTKIQTEVYVKMYLSSEEGENLTKLHLEEFGLIGFPPLVSKK